MIPILYAGNEQSFLNNGLGRLSDAISCKVTEERNGVFELEMTYPITGIHFADIAENCIIYAKTEDGGNNQAFIIYKISKPLNGIVTINAQHISYLLNGFIVFPFTATSLSDAMSQIVANTTPASIPFTFYTDIVSNVRFTLDTPRTVRGLLGGQSGSLLDVYGGYDYKFDNFTVRLLAHRGMDRGVTIRYGKNLTSLKNVNDMTSVYTGIVPYWADSEGNTVYLTEKVVYSQYASLYPYKIIKTVDFSSDFDSQPTEAQLRQKAQAYIENNKGWKIKNNIDVSFVALSQSEEYKNIAPLENVKLCDTVTIRYDKLGVNTSARVIKTVYNVLLERYDSITLGDTTYTLAQAIQGEIDAPTMSEVRSFTQSAVEHATKLIQGGLGGYVVFTTNGDGEPEEITIMNKPTIEEAESCIRINKNGIGFSTTGYDGVYANAWTIDGNLVADFITTGSLNAALITVGILKDTQNKNYWNMATGEFKLSSGAQIGNSTIASNADVGTAVDNYDNSLNQSAVFNKLTNNGQLQGIYMQNGNLYINGSYIQSGVVSAGLITSGILEDGQQKNYWNMQTGEFKLSPTTAVGNSTVASSADVAAGDSDTLDAANSAADDKISNYNTSLDQSAVFNKLTNNGTIQGIYMDNGQLYVNGAYMKAQSIEASALTVNATNTIISSTVKKDSVISSINQSAEQVSISASKIDLSGDLDLHGTFTTDKTTSQSYQGYYAKMDACRLRFFDPNDQVQTGFELMSSSGISFIGLTIKNPTDSNKNVFLGPVRCNLPAAWFNGDTTFGTPQDPCLARFYSTVEFKNSVYDLSGGLLHTSDRRKKHSIKDLVIEKAKSFIMGLKPRKFKFSKDLSTSNRYHHGFIAQEVKEAMGEDWGVYVENKEKDFIGLRYDELIADMVAVIQDQEKRIDALERRLNDITNNQP